MIQENIIRHFEKNIKRHWNFPAFSNYRGQTFSYADVARQLLIFHALFRKNHLKRGDKIALAGRNSAQWAMTYLAALTYGAVIVPILPDFHPEDIQHLVNHSESILLFASREIYEQLDETQMKGLEAILDLEQYTVLYHKKKNFIELMEEAQRETEQLFRTITPDNFSFQAHTDHHETAALIYTSGTTGFSKGVMLSGQSLLANVIFAEDNMKMDPGDRMLSFLPLSHAYAASFEFLFPFNQGCHVTFLSQIPSPKILLKAFADVRPVLILMVPLIMEKIYKKQLAPLLEKLHMKVLMKVPVISRKIQEKIRTRLTQAFGGTFDQIIIGGAALNPEVEGFLKKIGFPFTVGYGMTECGPLISYTHAKQHRIYSVGQPMTYLEARIDSPDPKSQDGEIQVRGGNVMSGYYKNKEATQNAFTADGWLRTGDLGLMDDEGFISIKGRSKNMILGPSGQNIYPEEIEGRLANLPFVQECLIVETGAKLVALVYPDYEEVDAHKTVQSDLTAWLEDRMEENRQILNQNLASYCQIARIELRGTPFEKTPTQKIKRFLYQI